MSNSIQLTRFPNGTVTTKAVGNPALFFLGVCVGAYAMYKVIEYANKPQLQIPDSTPKRFLDSVLKIA